MTRAQAAWAKGHKWYFGFIHNADDTFTVIAATYDMGELLQFDDFKALKEWAKTWGN